MQQQAQIQTEKSINKQLTPIEKLLADKNILKEKCRTQEKKLNDDFTYIRDNATSLLLSGVSALIFPPKNTPKTTSDKQLSITSGTENNNTSKSQLSISEYFTIAKSLLPVAWEIVQPIIIAWGIKKAKSFFLGLFTEKKSKPSRK